MFSFAEGIMIIYNRNLKELKNEVKEVCGVVCKVPIVVGIIFLIIAMYFLLVGFIDDKEALGYGYWCVVIFTVCLILTLRI